MKAERARGLIESVAAGSEEMNANILLYLVPATLMAPLGRCRVYRSH